MKVAVISSVYGGYDVPAAPFQQDIDCEYVLVSDREYDCWPWKVIVEPRPQLHPRLAAKVAKCRPDLYADADIYIWVDASVRITHPDFATWATSFLEQGPLAQFPHPARTRIVDEMEVSEGIDKYAGLPCREQVASYINSGYPDGWGLWATGVIVRAADGPRFGDAWLAEQVRWTYQDQLSEAPILHRLGVRPVDLPGDLYGNPRFEIRNHL